MILLMLALHAFVDKRYAGCDAPLLSSHSNFACQDNGERLIGMVEALDICPDAQTVGMDIFRLMFFPVVETIPILLGDESAQVLLYIKIRFENLAGSYRGFLRYTLKFQAAA